MTNRAWNTGSGNWDIASNWTPTGVPTSSDNVDIATGSSSDYTITGSGAAGTLTDTLAGEVAFVTLAGTFDVGSADISGPAFSAPLVIAAGANLNVRNTLSCSGGVLGIYGTLTDGDYEGSSYGIRNLAGVTVSGASSRWLTSGTLEMSNFAFLSLNDGAFVQADAVEINPIAYSTINTSSTLLGVNELKLGNCLIENGAFVEAPSISVGGIIDNGTLIGTDEIAFSNSEIEDGAYVNAPTADVEPNNTVTIDTVSTLSANSIVLGGTLTVAPGTVDGSHDTLIFGSITVADAGAPALVGSPGATLEVVGAISGGDASRVNIDGTVVLANAHNNYGHTTVGADGSASTLVLAARGAAGDGAITLTGSADMLYVEQDASGNPDGTTSVVARLGSDTIFAANTSVLARGVIGSSLLLINGNGVSTVSGGGGSETVFGGNGGGLFFGGTAGNNLLLASGGAATLVGGGNADQLWADNGTGNLIVAGSGNETLGASDSTRNNVLFGGTGNDLIAAATGDMVVAGSGTPTIFGGRNTTVFAGSGADLIALGSGPDYVQIGTGNATIFAGADSDLFGVYNGQAGGNDLLIGFKSGIDHILLGGYSEMPNVVSQGGNTTITLSDNTHVTLVGVSNLAPNALI